MIIGSLPAAGVREAGLYIRGTCVRLVCLGECYLLLKY